MIGDGEAQEGQIWEAAMLASQHKLNHLILLLDNNKMQIDGRLDEIVSLGALEEKWRAFGFHTIRIDGHDVSAIYDAITTAKTVQGSPTVIILDTLKGKGVSFAENKDGCHHMTISKDQYDKALAELYAESGDENA